MTRVCLSRVHQNKEVKEKAAADAASNVKVKDEPMDDSDDVKTSADASDSAAAGEVIDVSRELLFSLQRLLVCLVSALLGLFCTARVYCCWLVGRDVHADVRQQQLVPVHPAARRAVRAAAEHPQPGAEAGRRGGALQEGAQGVDRHRAPPQGAQ